jgi:hypothetical protein
MKKRVNQLRMIVYVCAVCTPQREHIHMRTPNLDDRRRIPKRIGMSDLDLRAAFLDRPRYFPAGGDTRRGNCAEAAKG